MARPLKNNPLPPEELIEALRASLAFYRTVDVNPEEVAKLEAVAEALREDRKATQTLVLAAIQDQPCPIAFFKPWCSYPRIYIAERAGELTTIVRRNGKILIKPSDFFAWFSSIPTDARRKSPNPKAS